MSKAGLTLANQRFEFLADKLHTRSIGDELVPVPRELLTKIPPRMFDEFVV